LVKKLGASDDQLLTARINSMDYEFLDVFKMKLIAGRMFSRDFIKDSDTSIIITTSAAKLLGYKKPEDAIGQTIAIPDFQWNPIVVGVNTDRLAEVAELDAAISEFSRFYLERRAQEIQGAGSDERKKKKLEDEFTPRLDMTLVALEGKLHRELKISAQSITIRDVRFCFLRINFPYLLFECFKLS